MREVDDGVDEPSSIHFAANTDEQRDQLFAFDENESFDEVEGVDDDVAPCHRNNEMFGELIVEMIPIAVVDDLCDCNDETVGESVVETTSFAVVDDLLNDAVVDDVARGASVVDEPSLARRSSAEVVAVPAPPLLKPLRVAKPLPPPTLPRIAENSFNNTVTTCCRQIVPLSSNRCVDGKFREFETVCFRQFTLMTTLFLDLSIKLYTCRFETKYDKNNIHSSSNSTI